MTDLVKRLRKMYGRIDYYELGNDAADEIERLIKHVTSLQNQRNELKSQLRAANEVIEALEAK